ncbi:hypothetical protein V8G54_027994 [Vigna mungo]|uniref:Uncharacterized protein n=1 Tax=Vigna mungo TaxID=3915 RepID=A0AAQ3MRW4_VIGMU
MASITQGGLTSLINPEKIPRLAPRSLKKLIKLSVDWSYPNEVFTSLEYKPNMYVAPETAMMRHEAKIMNQRPVITWRMKALVFVSSSSTAIFGGNTNQTLSLVVDLEPRLCEYVYIAHGA